VVKPPLKNFIIIHTGPDHRGFREDVIGVLGYYLEDKFIHKSFSANTL